jgi:S1-C subfamily serine protease
MRPWPGALFMALLSLAGCAAAPPHAASVHAPAWRRVCACFAERPAGIDDVCRLLPDSAQETALLAKARAVADAVVHVRTRVVERRVARNDGSPFWAASHTSGGTGVAIGCGLVLTAGHVVRGASQITVVLADGSCRPVERVLVDPEFDLALLRVSIADVPAVDLGVVDPQEGSPVVALGRSSPDAAVVARTGIITKNAVSLQPRLDPRRRLRYDRLIESSVRLEPGFSGGPLLDVHGRVVGLNVALVTTERGGAARAYSLPLTGEVCRSLVELSRRARAGGQPTAALPAHDWAGEGGVAALVVRCGGQRVNSPSGTGVRRWRACFPTCRY